MSSAQTFIETDLDAEEVEDTEEEVYVPVYLNHEELRALFTEEAIAEREDDLAICQCINNDVVGCKITQTQFNGKILENPIYLDVFASTYEATDFMELHRGGGSYAIREVVYECGHTNFEWQDYWHNSGSRT